LEVKTVDTWGSVTFHYSNADLLDACQKLLSCSGQFGSEDTYQYDLVVTTSQLLSNFSQKPYQELVAAFNAHDRQKMDQAGQEFLDLMSDEDELLSTRKEFLLGSWLEAARSWGQTDAEKNYYQTMARYLVTDWGPPAAARDLHEYSHRALAGLVRDYYRARWQMFIQQLDDNLDGHAVLIDFVTWEQQWAQRTDAYPNTPTGNAVAVTEKLLAKYGPMIQAAASPLK
jgi:alpha-N-acetylglucosaminidase